MSKSKTAKEMSEYLTKTAKGLEAHTGDHPALEPLIRQIQRKAAALVREPKEVEPKPVKLAFSDDEITIEEMPGLWPKARFYAFNFKMAEAKGIVKKTNADGTVVYETSYNKERGKHVLPLEAQERMVDVLKSFFPKSEIEEAS